MTLSPIQTIEYDGQTIKINHESKVVMMKINEPFFKAGKLLGWIEQYGSPGFGFNKKIINYVIKNKMKLLIRSDTLSDKKEYWTVYDKISWFVSNHKTHYTIKGIELIILPLKFFNSKPVFGAEN